MSIEKKTATVFYAPTRGRRYFSKTSAINAEASALILKEYPVFHYEGRWCDDERSETEHEDIRIDEPIAYRVMLHKLIKLLKDDKIDSSWLLDEDHAAWSYNFDKIKDIVDKKITERLKVHEPWQGLDNVKRENWADRIGDFFKDEEIIEMCEGVSNHVEK